MDSMRRETGRGIMMSYPHCVYQPEADEVAMVMKIELRSGG